MKIKGTKGDMMQSHAFTNNLIHESSPYLLQHAHNPVKWYPWGEEAFQRAHTEHKPIFLSIGYSTCHWCHVMERESFEDEAVGKLLNENYIAIKVDREERPDVDAIYMRVCQALTGSGGWPLSIIMTPDKKPFFAGTYFPKETRGQYYGLMDILRQIATMWQNDRDALMQNSDEIHEHLITNLHATASSISADATDQAFDALTKSFDRIYGGFGVHPKFPTPHTLLFLLRTYKHTQNIRALRMVQHTLKSIYKGGIFDHVGYGFSRYATDHRWLVPHFEKMLYDNALLAMAYLETYTLTGDDLYRKVAEKLFSYVLRDMTDAGGAFFSAEDAESEGVEGKYYVWIYDELRSHLDEDELKLLADYYGVTKDGNFEGKNILNLIDTDIDIVEHNQTHDKIEAVLQKLYAIRQERIPPFKDTKVLTSWNGLMIAALSMGGRILHDERYTDAAKRAVGFIKGNMMQDDRLLSSYKDGRCSSRGYVDDYAFYTWGLLELFSTTNEATYLEEAMAVTHTMLDHFWDEKDGGLYLYGKEHETLLLRPKEHYDGATPSGNAVALHNLTTLYHYTHDEGYKEKAEAILQTFGASINRDPTSHAHFLSGYLELEMPHRQVVLSGEMGNDQLTATLHKIHQRFLPFTTVIINDGNEQLLNLMPEIQNYPVPKDGVQGYICENFSCQPPIQDMDALIAQLD